MDNYFQTSDGADIHYIEEGNGKTIILIHGWGCAAELYKYQIKALKDKYHVIAVDLRGHGDSKTPGYGFRISRLAKDIQELILHIGEEKVILCGHSMGCSIIWSYIELFGQDRLYKIVLIDEDPVIIDFPSWTDEEREHFGGLFSAQLVFDTVSALKGDNGDAVASSLLGGLFTSDVDEETKNWAISHALKASRSDTADLIFNHSMNDWSKVIPTIKVPTLVVGGKLSAMNYKSIEWIGSVIKNSQTFIMEEKSSHFMFIENHKEFNSALLNFLTD
ncbi:AB hydrolase superfamily protein YdjP [bioreactor metagenome]|uniref:AB hydrolase superfamily protein YdjP n=1 Tax=bioreactor metagenome TaxID=1076179 RepID=A0A645C6I5_9ZZZZ|nr:alpha/beta hydrolase [Candidatus Metalachnospira sp.]